MRCIGITKTGKRCNISAVFGNYCTRHIPEKKNNQLRRKQAVHKRRINVW